MTDTLIDPGSPQDSAHLDKYNDPRARITFRGVMIGLAVTALAVVGAIASIYGRRTRLEQTTRFWGQETILALQLGERIALQPLAGREFTEVELTGMPGLGHLRHLLLDERNFDWSSEESVAVGIPATQVGEDLGPEELAMRAVSLRITDPTGQRVSPRTIDLDLVEGWVGLRGVERRVKLNERKLSGLKNFLKTIVNKQQDHYDRRNSGRSDAPLTPVLAANR